MTTETINGINKTLVLDLADSIREDESLAQCLFKAQNVWSNGTLNTTCINSFKMNNSSIQHKPMFILTCDEPAELGGVDSAPNPVEFLLHALLGCITTTIIAYSAVNNLVVEELYTESEGELDLRGFLGLSEDVRKGFSKVSVIIDVKTDGDSDTIKEFAQLSPVYDTISKSVPVDIIVRKVI